jgi:predicted metal-binding membrane protein
MPARKDRLLGALEFALIRERLVLASMLGLFTLLSWAWILVMAQDMVGTPHGAAAWMTTSAWDAPHLVLLWAMWAIMMSGMMLPSAAPMILMYTRAAQAERPGSAAAHRAYGLTLGYLLVWALFSVGATYLQRVLAVEAFLSPMMEPATSILAPALLLVAGGYQMTPLKQACLGACRSPLSFLMGRWQPGWTGALRMGIRHGLYCLGCCWALMLLLFAGGVMNLLVIAALTFWVMIEKLLPLGKQGSYVSGVALIGTGIWMLAG